MTQSARITGTRTLALLLTLVFAFVGCGPEDGQQDDDFTVTEDEAVEEERRQERVQEPERQPAGEFAEEAEEAALLVEDALGTVREMKADPELWSLVEQSQGIFIMPTFGRAAAGAGVSGGEGVFLAREGGEWSDPVFYDVGEISVGAQLGGSGGQVAMILLSQEALDSFKQETEFSLDANAGLVLGDYSEVAQASVDDEDVILWSDTEGAFAGVNLGISGISYDEEETRAYYQEDVTQEDILTGNVQSPQEELLRSELSSE